MASLPNGTEDAFSSWLPVFIASAQVNARSPLLILPSVGFLSFRLQSISGDGIFSNV